MKFHPIFLLLIISINVFSNEINIDSLGNILKISKEDTNKVNILNNIAWELKNSNPDTSIILSKKALNISESINWQKGICLSEYNLGVLNTISGNYSLALSYYFNILDNFEKSGLDSALISKTIGNIGSVYSDQDDYHKALEYYQMALKLDEDAGNNNNISIWHGNIGNIYRKKGDFPKALEYYFKALKIDEEAKNKHGIARHYGNIGIIYADQRNFSKALEYYFKAVNIDEELGNKIGIARHLGNIGNVYYWQEDYQNTIEYYFKALQIDEELGNKNGIARHLGNIGNVYADQAKAMQKQNKTGYDSLFIIATDYFFRSLKIRKELNAKNLIASTLGNIGSLYTLSKKYKAAEKYLIQALEISIDINALNLQKEHQQYLYELYFTCGRPDLALEHYKKYIVARDSIFNIENASKLIRSEMNFEFEKKDAIAKAEQGKKDAIATAEFKRQQAQRNYFIIGFGLVLILALIIFRSYRQKQKANIIIAEQKKEIEEKHKETTDSITYARRLQQAILPPTQFIKKHLPNTFVLYSPKDIVAGDFYWMEVIDDIIFLAVADCTGHGVPGAMVSVVCSNALNRTVKEFGLRDTGKILDKVTDLVLETFEKSGEQIKDGMDISLLSYDKTSKQIKWSGANNPLWYIQNGQVVEIKADKQPVGKFDKRKSFTTHNIEHSDNSVFYLFTDGLPDQFGGPKGKKFMYKRFENNLSDISKLPMDEQQAVLEKTFQDWKGSLEQVDDVTVIGIKI